MPIYEYQCASCAKEFETLVRGAADVPRCPSCGGIDLSRLFSVPAASRDGASRGGSLPLANDRPAFGCGGGGCQTGMCGLD